LLKKKLFISSIIYIFIFFSIVSGHAGILSNQRALSTDKLIANRWDAK